MSKEPEWQLDTWIDHPGYIHLSPMYDAFDHRMELDSACWCGAWLEKIDDGLLVHHLNATQRLSLNRLGARTGEKLWLPKNTTSSFLPS